MCASAAVVEQPAERFASAEPSRHEDPDFALVTDLYRFRDSLTPRDPNNEPKSDPKSDPKHDPDDPLVAEMEKTLKLMEEIQVSPEGRGRALVLRARALGVAPAVGGARAEQALGHALNWTRHWERPGGNWGSTGGRGGTSGGARDAFGGALQQGEDPEARGGSGGPQIPLNAPVISQGEDPVARGGSGCPHRPLNAPVIPQGDGPRGPAGSCPWPCGRGAARGSGGGAAGGGACAGGGGPCGESPRPGRGGPLRCDPETDSPGTCWATPTCPCLRGGAEPQSARRALAAYAQAERVDTQAANNPGPAPEPCHAPAVPGAVPGGPRGAQRAMTSTPPGRSPGKRHRNLLEFLSRLCGLLENRRSGAAGGGGAVAAVTIYNAGPDWGVHVGDALAVPDPLVTLHQHQHQGQTFSFMGIRVSSPLSLVVNGRRPPGSALARPAWRCPIRVRHRPPGHAHHALTPPTGFGNKGPFCWSHAPPGAILGEGMGLPSWMGVVMGAAILDGSGYLGHHLGWEWLWGPPYWVGVVMGAAILDGCGYGGHHLGWVWLWRPPYWMGVVMEATILDMGAAMLDGTVVYKHPSFNRHL
ncbi:tetratricopeptide repeat protein 5 [Chiroxiphia lanceolata]|uniref:tetratricopeptide repeat protein 5 n=1 Tax=Chiroxiphia lanceolata TaxID=296741 RepID=UPI0013CEDD6C|nr:tetratricopeptide repeat protein 5 [Chiroxiphia lanceolata]